MADSVGIFQKKYLKAMAVISYIFMALIIIQAGVEFSNVSPYHFRLVYVFKGFEYLKH